ncbi:MAG TPA: TetR/AcrR family transcriptional regulator [Arenicellales bacterium]|nr:TetR/AcrR family transcriptional regulator [Arenicellales bacterium]
MSTYHHGDLRPALVDAASAILDEGGINALSLRGVARRAGVSQAAPYHHFKDKEDLLAAVAAQGFRALTSGLKHAGGETPVDPRSRLQALGRAYVDFAVAHPGMFGVMFGPGIPDHHVYPDLIDAGRTAYGILADAVAAVLGHEASPRCATATVGAWGLVHGLAVLFAEGRIGRDLHMADIVTDATGAYAAGLAAVIHNEPENHR